MLPIVAVFLCALLFPTFNSELSAIGERSGDVVPGRLSLPQRLGYAILLNSGLASLSPMSEEERNQLRLNAQLPWPVDSGQSPLTQCMVDSKARDDPLDVRALSIAIVAAEMYNRGWLARTAKTVLGRLHQYLLGTYPNFSYGIAQVKLTTARKIIESGVGSRLSDADLFELLQGDCDSINVASRYIESLAVAQPNTGGLEVRIDRISAIYSGAERSSEGSFLYGQSVIGAYFLLKPDRTGEEQAIPDDKVKYCVTFARGDETGTEIGDVADLIKDAPKAGIAVHAEIWTDETSPSTYREGLTGSRSEWLVGELVRMGFDRDRVTVTAMERKLAKSSTLCGLSYAMITVDMPLPKETPAAEAPADKAPLPEPAPAVEPSKVDPVPSGQRRPKKNQD